VIQEEDSSFHRRVLPKHHNNIVPFLKGIGVRLKISMLAPSFEMLNALKTLVEAVNNTLDILT
jgi:hypothetical protein